MAKTRILIVEDERIVAQDMRASLGNLGYSVPVIVSSGEEAVKKTEELRPDLVLMDIVLRGDMDGIEAAEQIRTRFNIPVVYLTAYADKKRLERAKLTQPFGYILKPFDDRELHVNIEMALYKHKMERELKESEEDWRNSFDALEDVMMIIDKDFNIENINDSGLALLGKTREEVIGRKCYQLLHGADSPVEYCPRRRSLESKKMESIERYEERFSRYFSMKGAPIFDENWEIMKSIHLWRDITERKRAEEELIRLSDAVKMSTDSIVVSDLEGKIIEVNEATLRMYGTTDKEDLIGENSFDLIAPEDREKAFAGMNEVWEKGYPLNREYHIITKDGSRILVEMSSAVMKDAEGKAIGFVGVSRDITERKKAEAALRESEEMYRNLVSNLADVVLEIDSEGKFTYVSPQIFDIFGYTPDESVGLAAFDFVHPDDIERCLEAMASMVEVYNLEYRSRHKDGHYVDVSTSGKLVPDGRGGTKMISVVRDITERKKAEEQLKHSFVDLARTLSRTMETRDPYTSGHQRRVAELAHLVGKKMGLDGERLNWLYIGGLIHDIGKISTPEVILTKPGKLSNEEWGLIRVHTKQGYEILKDTKLPWPVADMALHHHERLDGSGYPHGISGDELILEVRILGVCDVAEAMGSHRPYRPARSKEEVLQELRSGRGTKYDADVVDAVLEIIESGEFELGAAPVA